jgi:hypothetical protein
MRRTGAKEFNMSTVEKLVILGALALVGCDSPQAKAREAEIARQAADKSVAQIAEATERKEANVQRKATNEIARVASDGEDRIVDAKMRADRKESEATQALWQAREEARGVASRRLDRVDRDLAALRPTLEKRLSTAGAASVVSDIDTRAAALRTRVLELDHCGVDELASIKDAISAGLDELERALADAKKRV